MLLSGSDCSAEALATATPPAVTTAARRVATTSLAVGTYKGTVKASILPIAVPATLVITSVKPDGTVTGKISAPYVGVKSFAVRGTVNSKGVFTVTYNKNGISGTISGSKKSNGHLTGKFNGKGVYQSMPLRVSGTFDFKKTA
jgi:hypothetical protein